jgi:hypothetical protein
VSRLSRSQLRLGLGSKWLTLAGYRAGPRPKLARKEIILVDPSPDALPWQAAVDALPAALSSDTRAEVTVILSNHFVRYTLLPWDPNVKSKSEWLAFARHRFAEIHGTLAEQWVVRVSESAPRAARVASAVDQPLIDTLVARLQDAGATLISIQPYLMAAFNRLRRAIGRDSCWLVVEEPGRLTLALILRGEWFAIRGRRKDEAWRESLPQILERESAILALEEPCTKAVIHSHVAFDTDSYDTLRLQDLTLAAGAAPGDRNLAMALA